MISDAHPEYREYRAQYQTLQTHDPSQPVDAWGDTGEDEAGLIESTCYDTVSPGNFNPHLVTLIRGSTSMVQPLVHLQHQRIPDATFFVLKNVSHFIPQEGPSELSQILSTVFQQ